ncbi:MAG: C4-dicarboxylate ABC transporter substrate-binding protein [Sneathiella sp.]|uniref:TAXI family TRAP transporter solute-binding subunit n=1 Tax=Sneathiella sp. TaxID=1964365 RepID=UPI000C60986B|nr:TAXI family TRAP transporter solute-binding subunit [Sneathiella sp.]MAZ01658.1 C4-dicarboxylate ABC transporter substrate-binding protein [Sneathiella sp.]
MTKFLISPSIVAFICALTTFAFPQIVSAKDFYRMATLGPGTTPYMVSTTFATIVNKELKDQEIQVNATGKGTQHAIEAAKGQLDFFITANIVQRLMSSGKAMYSKISTAPEMSKKLRSLFMFPAGTYHFVVYEKSGIKEIKDIKDKKVFVGPKGSAINNVVQAIIKGSTGYEAGKDYEAVETSFDAGGAAFQDQRVDVYVNITNPPSPVISQVSLTNEIRLLDLGDVSSNPELTKLYENRPGRFIATIAADAYGENQMNTSEVQTLGAYMGMATNEDVPEEDVYNMLKIFWTGLDEMKSESPWLSAISLDSVFASANMPLHLGAVKYYQEVGLEIPAELLPAN